MSHDEQERDGMSDAKAVQQRTMRAAWWLRRQGHRRLADMVDQRPWWDWGHRLMAATGDDRGGLWSTPDLPTWWYHFGTPTRQRFTGFPRYPRRKIEVIKDYSTFCERTEGLNEDEMYEWKAFNGNQDDDLQFGHQYWGKGFYGLNRWEVALLARYLVAWKLHDWFGLRTSLYNVGLHAAVYRRKPFACNVTPPRDSGGYDHWYCTEPRSHRSPHRFRNYTWAGGAAKVVFEPAP